VSIDNIRFTLNYWALKSALMNEWKYSQQEAKHQIAELRRMEPRIVHAFLEWRRTKALPAERINGMSVQDIITHDQVDPYAAFLSWNWLALEPEEAYYALNHPVDTMEITENDKDQLRRIARQRGWKIDEPEEPEDTSDLSEPENP